MFSIPANSTASITTAKAEEAAQAWLKLTDAGQYAQSWDTASSLFQGSITQSNWEQALRGARLPLGSLKSRKLKSATYTKTLPGAPDGEYVVIQFNSQFEKKASAIETVTPQQEQDGTWKVSGYYIK
jgi:hypothetical protein